MSTEFRTIKVAYPINVEQIGNQLADWALYNHGFTLTQKTSEHGKFVIKLAKSGVMRQLAGLVFTYKVELSQTDNSIIVMVDDGDLRNQLASLGVAWFIAWPMLLTAGYGIFAKGEFRQAVFAEISKMTQQNTPVNSRIVLQPT